jgi:hypothetical protein
MKRCIDTAPEVSDGFDSLCKEVGLAVLMSQKVQFSLACYYAVAIGKTQKWTRADYQATIDFYLSKPMGTVVTAIANDAPLPVSLSQKVDFFRITRNWLVHDFDQEATPALSKGNGFDDYAARMRMITQAASDLMHELDAIGESLVPTNETY